VLFTATLRRAIFQVSNGTPVEDAVNDAKSRYMLEASNPGLDLPPGSKPYTIARDWCAMLDTVVRGAARLTLLTVKESKQTKLSENVKWQVRSWADESGQLHRWIIVDSWSQDDLYRELHGWHTFGDIAVTQCPLMLHVVEIGSQRNGRRASSWARAFQHPAIPHLKLRFRKSDGSALDGWRSYYLADAQNPDPDGWVEQMALEGECERLMRHITINVPPKQVCEDTVQQIVYEAHRYDEARSSTQWHDQPMSRGACDGYSPCVYQPVCYSEKLVNIEELGLYKATQSLEQIQRQPAQ